MLLIGVAACSTPATETYRAYDGHQLASHSVVTIRLPDGLKSVQLNGESIDPARYIVIELQDGKHVITLGSGERFAFIIRPIAIDAMRPKLRNELLIGHSYRIDRMAGESGNDNAFAVFDDRTGQVAVMGISAH